VVALLAVHLAAMLAGQSDVAAEAQQQLLCSSMVCFTLSKEM
jgi:hypothetical protein